jgi:hypothetical protein
MVDNQEILTVMPGFELGGSVVMPRLLVPREAAEVIGKSEKWLELDRRTGPTIPFVRLGRSVRYRAEVLRDVVLSHEVEAVR